MRSSSARSSRAGRPVRPTAAALRYGGCAWGTSTGAVSIALEGVGHRLDARTPAVDERLRRVRVGLDHAPRGGIAFARYTQGGLHRLVVERPAQLLDRLADPGELSILAVDDVLVGVVEVVL